MNRALYLRCIFKPSCSLGPYALEVAISKKQVNTYILKKRNLKREQITYETTFGNDLTHHY